MQNTSCIPLRVDGFVDMRSRQLTWHRFLLQGSDSSPEAAQHGIAVASDGCTYEVLPPEPQEGNIEYKVGFQHILSLLWRPAFSGFALVPCPAARNTTVHSRGVMLCLQYMLVEPTQERFEHLVTQMKWRLSESEGVGEAIYEIGGIYTPSVALECEQDVEDLN